MNVRERSILGCAGMTVLVALLWFGLLAPKHNEAKDLGASVTQAQQSRTDALAQAVAGEAAKASYPRDYATVARLGKAVPTQADVPSLVYQLESAARRAKVDFRSMAIDSPAAEAPGATLESPATTVPGGVVPTPFSFTIEGSYFGVRRMLSALREFSRVKGKQVSVSGRLLTLDAVKLSAGRKLLPQIKADITAKAYVAPTPALTGVASPAATASTAALATSTTASQVTP
jgi:Tfp pilus assembly protein PilO